MAWPCEPRACRCFLPAAPLASLPWSGLAAACATLSDRLKRPPALAQKADTQTIVHRFIGKPPKARAAGSCDTMPDPCHSSPTKDQFPATPRPGRCISRCVNKSEFETRLRALTQSHAAVAQNEGCVACDRCQRCTRCTFCRDSERLVRCHYCMACNDCIDSSHCRSCTGCFGCTHCIASERCSQSAYLVRCVGLSGCSYCFGCVGLAGKDFHILNEPYDRSTYFSLTAQLTRELGI